MALTQIDNQHVESIDYTDKSLINHHFANCVFTNCNFTNTDISYTDFEDCTFNICNFSQTIVNTTGLKNVVFNDTKLLGFKFNHCKDFLFEVRFKNCQLDFSSFYEKKMKKTIFANCSIKEVDFENADISMVIFDNCDLQNSSFVNCNLEKTDFRTARNFMIDPEQNKIKKAKFSHLGLEGLLSKYGIEVEY